MVQHFDNLDIEDIKIRTEVKNKALQKVNSLLEDILYWSRSKSKTLSLSLERFNFYDLCGAVIFSLKEQARLKNITLNIGENPNSNITADKNMIKVILRNLLSNAIKYSEENGNINISSKTLKNTFVFLVSDDGVGICKKDINKLFDAGWNLSKKGTKNEPGMGIGLQLCKHLVELHGGKICVKSELNKGSVFSVSIPHHI